LAVMVTVLPLLVDDVRRDPPQRAATPLVSLSEGALRERQEELTAVEQTDGLRGYPSVGAS
jgi:hypothetical protein